MSRQIITFFLWWALAAAAIACAGLAYLLHQHAPTAYNQVVVESAAFRPATTQQSLLVFDDRVVSQEFTATSSNITHLSLGVRNLNDASADSTLGVTLVTQHGEEIENISTSLSELWDDDFTILPFKASLTPGQRYILKISTQGVAKGNDISVFFNGDKNRFSDGRLTVTEKDAVTELSGNIGFRLYNVQTLQNTFEHTLRSPIGYLAISVIILWLVVGIAATILFAKKQATRFTAKPVTFEEVHLRISDFTIALGVGTALALFVTAPFYTTLGNTSIFGDIHRALVYRGVARDSLMQAGQMGLWEPYLCGGAPLLANSESAQLDPFFLFTLAFGEDVGLRISVTSMFIIGFAGAFAIARQFFGAGRVTALLGGAIFSFSGFQMLGFSEGAYAWLPAGWISWLMYFYFKSHTSGKSLYAIAAGAILAIMFLGGGIHITAWSGIALALLAIILCITYRSPRPVLLAAGVCAAALAFGAIKILPAAELQATSSFSRPEAFIPPLTWIPKMFWDRTQLETPPWYHEPAGHYFRWHDFGSYTGIVPVLLFAASFFFLRGKKLHISVAVASVLLLAMTYGLPPWSWITQTQALEEILRNPQRARAVFVLFMGILSAFALKQIGVRFVTPHVPSQKVVTVLYVVLIGAIAFDLSTFHHHEFFETFNLPKANLSRVDSFMRLDTSFADPETGHYKASYDTYLSGRGTTDSCLPFMAALRSNTSGVDTEDKNRPYKGEAYIVNSSEANFKLLTPNSFSVLIPEPQSGWLIVNTNYFSGWHTRDGRAIWPREGKLAVRTTEEDKEIHFEYIPQSYKFGRAITVFTLALLVFLLAIPIVRMYKK